MYKRQGFFDEFLGFDGGRADQAAKFQDFGSDAGAAGDMFFDMLGGMGGPMMGMGGPMMGDPFGDPFGGPMMDMGPGDPGGWGGPVFEFGEDGGLEGDFFRPQNEFVFDPFGGPGGFGPPEGGFDDMPGGEGFAAMGEFFQDFMGPEGAEGMGPDGPGLAAGARNFFNPNSEGGFDPTMFFEDARGMDDGMDPFGMLSLIHI